MSRLGIKEVTAEMKSESVRLAATSGEQRNKALQMIADALLLHADEIFAANKADLDAAREADMAPSLIGRLKFDEHKLSDVTAGIKGLIGLPDPIGKVQLKRELDEGLLLVRESCPIGVIGVIFESRPDALVQVSTLCLKSGNCVVLKGGSEAKNTNRALFDVIYSAAVRAGLPKHCMFLAEDRSEIKELLECDGSVDLLIPRGSNAFVRYIMDNSRIPVMGHADGICHVYVDKDADIDKAVRIAVDAKTQYAAACNAAETLLVHRDIAGEFLPKLAAAYKEKNVEIRGTCEVRRIIDCTAAVEEDFETEYLAFVISVKLVGDVQEAIDHINKFGSHHTDAIVTENAGAAGKFMAEVDSAGVYQNASTRFADGFRYGFGAEVGISTGKIHARGPVGLEGLCTYKYKLYGSGDIVADYAEGRKEFHFRDL